MEKTYNRRLRTTLLTFILIPFIVASFIFMGFYIKGIYKKTDEKIVECSDKFIDRVNEYVGTSLQRVRFVNYYSSINACLMNTEKKVIDGDVININNSINDVIGAMLSNNDLSELCIFTNNQNAIPISVISVVDDAYIKKLNVPDEQELWTVDSVGTQANLCLYKKYSIVDGFENIIRIRIPIMQLLKNFSSSNFDHIQVKFKLANSEEFSFGVKGGKLTSEEFDGKVYKKDFELSNINAHFSVSIEKSYIIKQIIWLCFVYFTVVIFLLTVAFLLSRIVSENITSELNSIISFIGKSNAERIKSINVKNKEFKIIQKYLTDLTDRIKEENDEKIELQTKLLSQRITPHFIYNNLSAIKSTSADRFTRGAVDRFVKYCRNIFSNNSKFITLNNEIRNSCEYLDLLKFCYAFDFEVLTVIDDDCGDIIVPVNIMQPLLENAFIHGINRMPDDFDGVIKMTAKHDGEFLYITVSDNAGLLKKSEDDKKHHALDILRQLIDMYYKNDECAITLRSKENETVAEIKIEVKYEI